MIRNFTCPTCGEPAFRLDTRGWDRFLECPYCREHFEVYDDEAGPVELEHVVPCDDCGDWRPPDEMVGSRCPSCARESWLDAADRAAEERREWLMIGDRE